jgi:uncharacterized membrane protein
MEQAQQEKRTYAALALITLFGGALRFYHLAANSFWLDEMATWYFSAAPSFRDWFQGYYASHEPFPGTYYFFYFLWSKLFGISEWAYRVPSALAGTLAIPALFLLGRRMGGAGVGLLAAAFTAVGWAPIYYSQDARPYALLFLFAGLYCSAVIGVIQKKGRANEALFLLSAIGLTQLHYLGIFLFGLGIAFLLLCSIADRKVIPRIALWSSGLTFALYLPWLMRFISQLGYSPDNANIRQRSLWKTFTSFYKFCFFSDDQPQLLPFWLLYWLIMVLLLYFVFQAGKSRRRDLWMLLGWLVIPFFTLWLKSEFSQPAYRARYLIISLPAAITALACSLGLLFRSKPKSFAAAGALFTALFAGHVIYEFGYYSEARERKIESAFAEVSRRTEASDLKLVTCAANSKYLIYYINRYPSLRARWEGKENCGLEPHSPRPLAMLFHFTEPVENYAEGMRALGWERVYGSRAEDYSLFIYRP